MHTVGGIKCDVSFVILSFFCVMIRMSILESLITYSSAEFHSYFPRNLMSISTTDGSAKVEVSPSCSSSKLAIFLNTRLIIFPDLVFGREGAQ